MYKIEVVKKDELDTIKPLLMDYRYKSYYYYQEFTSTLLSEFLYNHIQNVLENEIWYCIGIKKNNKLVGLCILKKLNWDTEHFGFNVANIDNIISLGEYFESIKNKLKLLSFIELSFREDIRTLSCKTDPSDASSIHTLERKGFMIMDTLVTYSFDLRKAKIRELPVSCELRFSRKSDRESLKSLAYNSFYLDRFHVDPNYPKEKCDELHSKWIENACNGIGADRVIVAEIEDIPVGFTTVKESNDASKILGVRIASMILSAVSPKARGKGIYTSMINEGLNYLKDKADMVEVGTQGNNYPVQKSWCKLGFKMVKSQISFHKWYFDYE